MEKDFFSGDTSEQMSRELLILIEYIRRSVIKDLPSLTITPEYLILGILEKKDCLAHQVLLDVLSRDILGRIYSAFHDSAEAKALNAMRPNTVPKLSKLADEIIKDAFEIELPKFEGVNKLNSLHILLAILSEDRGYESIRRVFSAAKVTYQTIFDRAIDVFKEIVFEDNNAIVTLYNDIEGDIQEEVDDDEDEVTSIIIANPNMHMDNATMASLLQKVMGQKASTPAKQNGILDQICVNLNEAVNKGKIDPLVGREKEFTNLINILGRKKKNNAIIVGGDGVGKTAFCEGLAYKIVNGDVPTFLSDKTVWSLNLASLIAGAQYRGMLEMRLQKLTEELKKGGNNILYIDDISVAFADKKNSDVDISTLLSSILNEGSVQIIGSCGFKGYRTSFDSNPSLARKFQKIVLEETSETETINILNSLKEIYERHHGVKYENEAITACVRLAKKYIPERHLPDSAIDILDECGSRASIVSREDEEVNALRKDIINIEKHITDLKREDKYDEVETERTKLEDCRSQLNRKKQQNKANHIDVVISEENVCDYVSQKTGIPINRLTVNERQNILSINDMLKREIIGQDEAIDKVCKAIKRNRVGLGNKKTMGAFLMCGKTGVGKTLLAKQLAKQIFGDDKYLVRIDMSEYEDKTSVNKLIGSSAGYVGYENGGVLTEMIKNKKYCVLLLDEFEKANNEIYNLFLQVFDEGFLSDNTGQRIDFRNIIVIMTSNVGAKSTSEFGKKIGFDNTDQSSQIFDKELKRTFSPEFLNRLDDIICFNTLSESDMKKIIELEMNKLQEKLNIIGHKMTYDSNVINYIYDHIEEKDYGARPILRVIQNEIENTITDLILENDYKEHTFNITYFSGDTLNIA